MYVERILGVLNFEPIDICANPTLLPDAIMAVTISFGRRSVCKL
jgi:hypothetical protein